MAHMVFLISSKVKRKDLQPLNGISLIAFRANHVEGAGTERFREKNMAIHKPNFLTH